MCGACAGEHRNFDSIGAGVTGAPRPGPFQATDARGVPGERRTIDSIEADSDINKCEAPSRSTGTSNP